MSDFTHKGCSVSSLVPSTFEDRTTSEDWTTPETDRRGLVVPDRSIRSDSHPAHVL